MEYKRRSFWNEFKTGGNLEVIRRWEGNEEGRKWQLRNMLKYMNANSKHVDTKNDHLWDIKDKVQV